MDQLSPLLLAALPALAVSWKHETEVQVLSLSRFFSPRVLCVCVRAQVLWSREPLKAHRVPRIYRYIYLPAAFGVTTSSSSFRALKLFYISSFPFNIPVQAFLSLYLFLFVSPQIWKWKKMGRKELRPDLLTSRQKTVTTSETTRGKKKRKKAPLLKLWSKQKKNWNKIFKKKEEADHANAPRALDTWSRGGPQSIEQEKRGTSQGSLQPLFFSFFFLTFCCLSQKRKKPSHQCKVWQTSRGREEKRWCPGVSVAQCADVANLLWSWLFSNLFHFIFFSFFCVKVEIEKHGTVSLSFFSLSLSFISLPSICSC